MKKHFVDDHKHFVETLLLFDVRHLLFVKVKKLFVDDHKLFVETLLKFDVRRLLFGKVKKQIVEPTIFLHAGSQKPLACISKKIFLRKRIEVSKK